jgi:di/tricarboxylate transporter
MYAFTSTSLDDWIAQQISFLSNTNYIIILLVLLTMAILPTEMISNTAAVAAAELIPISSSLATSLKLIQYFYGSSNNSNKLWIYHVCWHFFKCKLCYQNYCVVL